MIIDQGNLLHGMGMLFYREFNEIAEPLTVGKGQILFRKGDPATSFFSLIDGNIGLSIGKPERYVYMVNRPGEIIGWSCLVGRNAYSATATVIAESRLFKVSKDDFELLMERHPKCGVILYKKLAQMVGNRLTESYRQLCESQNADF